MYKLFVFILVSFSVYAQDNSIQKFSLQDALDHALFHNNEAQNSKSDVRLAELHKWQTTST